MPKENTVTISINGKTSTVNSLVDLREILRDIYEGQFYELWLSKPNGASISALVNEDLCWLMYLRYDGDIGFSSRNPEVSEKSDQLIDFYLSNGQRDQYPLSYTVDKDSAIHALEHFFMTGCMASSIKWHDDSVLK